MAHIIPDVKPVVALAAVSAALAMAANGETIYQTVTDNSSGKEHLTKWDNGAALSSSADYVSDNTMTIRAPSSGNATFGGHSLRLGTVDGTSTTFIPYGATYTFNNGGLILAKGQFNTYKTGATSTINGLVTVTAPSTSPFEFWLSQGNNKNNSYVLSSKLSGAEGSGILVCNRVADCTGKFVLVPAADSDFAGTIKLGGKAVSEPYAIQCELQGNRTLPCTLWLTPKASLIPQNAGGTQWTVGTLRLDAGSTLLTKLTNDPKTSTITVTDSLTTAYPVNLTFPNVRTVDSGRGYVWDVLKMPLEKKDQIHPEHFVLATQEPAGLFPDAFPSVELRVAEKGDFAVLELEQRQVAQNTVADERGYGYSRQGFEFPTSMTNALAWSNKNLPMANIDYIAAYDLNAAPPSQCTDGAYAFPGASLTVKSEKLFCEAAHEFTIPVLRLENKAQFWPLGEIYADATAVVKGRIHVLPTAKTDDNPIIRVRRQTTVDIEAELTGSGNLQVQPNANDAVGARIVFDHDNSAFLGKIRIQSNTYTNDLFTKGQTLVLRQANNVGGPLVNFTADALEVRYFSTLEVTNDLTFVTANRGLTVNKAQINVGADAMFTFANDVTYAGPLTKVGAGRLVLGGQARGSAKTLTVAEGSLSTMTDTALDGVTVTFAEGATLAVDATSTSTTGAQLSAVTGTVPVSIVYSSDATDLRIKKLALCTAPSGTGVTAVRPRGHRVVLTSTDNGDGTETTFAEVTKAGLSIILR